MSMKAGFSLLLLLFSFAAIAAVDNIKVSSDFRYRHETLSQPKTNTTEAKTSRHRIRARLKVSGEVNEKIKGTFRLATGGSSGGITSTNATLDDADTKPIYLDLAFVTATLVDGLGIHAGKMKNPFADVGKTGVLFDGDYTPEGIALTYKRKDWTLNPDVALTHYRVNESNTESDVVHWGGQLGAKASLKMFNFNFGIANHHFSSIQGSAAVSTKSNSTTGGNFEFGYTILNYYLEAGMKTGKLKGSLYGQRYSNSDVKVEDSGYVLGVKLAYGSVSLNHNYRWSDKDSHIGAFSDGDAFGGDGTDGHGTKTSLKWKYMSNASFGGTFHSYNQHATDEHIEKIHLDFAFKF